MRRLLHITASSSAILALAAASVAGVTPSRAQPAVLRIGALYPLTGSQSSGGNEEFHGVQAAAALVNQRGGVQGRHVAFTTVNSPSADSAPDAVDRLKRQGVPLVVGSYGSTISLPASRESQRDNLIFWESGAVATMITQRGYPNVFRTVTTGNSLGRAAARYVASVVSPQLHLHPQQMRAAVVYASDVYGSSVGTSMAAESRALGFQSAGVYPYNPYHTTFPQLVRTLKAHQPDAILVTGYVPDAVAFRREILKQHVHPAVMIGTSSAFCMHAFGNTLQARALGMFASDKPDAQFSASALLPSARILRAQAVAQYSRMFHVAMTPAAVAGFVASWVLLHDVLPHASTLTPAGIRPAALRVNLPYGTEINGAGVRFAGKSAPDEGQNLRAISVIWQWQKPGHEYVVYPKSYATSSPLFVPLPGWTRR